MNDTHIASGRKKQKLKTRKRILEAANNLVESGKDITLEDVAKEAGISRATIYRYYSSIDSLSTELILHLNVPNSDIVLEKFTGPNIKKSLLGIQRTYLDFILENEKASKKFLGAILSTSDSKLERGQNRAMALHKYFNQTDMNLSAKKKKKLINLMVLLMGIEAIIGTKDVCGLDNEQSIQTLQWGLEMILKGCELD
ncbi:TetR/AcrR family transcriptional regulator [Flagellimonas sp. 2504JD1-5]